MTVPASQVIRVFLAITLASEGIGRITSMAPDTAKAQAAARSISSLFDTPLTSFDPISDAAGAEERAGAGARLAGRVEFRGVSFAYPTRPDVVVLKDLSLTVKGRLWRWWWWWGGGLEGLEHGGGSSSMRGSGTMARAMATRCFWPPESRPPPALHCVAKPCFSLMMKSCALASRAACTTARGRQKSRRDPVAPAAALAAVPTWGHVHVRLVDAGVAVADVVGDAVGEEDRLLLHQPQLRPQPPHAVPLNRRPVHRHLPARRRPLSAPGSWPGRPRRRLRLPG